MKLKSKRKSPRPQFFLSVSIHVLQAAVGLLVMGDENDGKRHRKYQIGLSIGQLQKSI